jgi:uridine phosphorylase
VNSIDEIQYHIKMKHGDVGRYVLLPGDPARCEEIAKHFDNPVLVSKNREFTTYTGYLNGEKVSVTSTGIGSPSTAIAIEELSKIGADTFIRVGTSGIINKDISYGDIIIVTAAIRDEGTSVSYIPIEFPAVANIDVTNCLIKSAISNNVNYFVGITQSKDSFYGQHEPKRMGEPNKLLDRWTAWNVGGALCSEMEASSIFVISSILKARSGGIMIAQDIKKQVKLDNLIKTAIDGIKNLILLDKKNKNGEKND